MREMRERVTSPRAGTFSFSDYKLLKHLFHFELLK